MTLSLTTTTPTTPAILIIVVTWNKKDYVIELLSSLASLTYPADQLDIIVVDNASTDGTVEALKKQFPEIKLLCNSENLGGTGGFNTGLAWAFKQPEHQYDYLWLLDNDVQVHKNALIELVNILQQNKDIAIAGSTMMQLDHPNTINEMGGFVNPNTGTLVFNRHLYKIHQWEGTPVAELLLKDIDLSQQLTYCQPWMDIDYVAAASLLIRSEVARKAGLWEDFFIHFDDVEWCLRVQKMGYRVVVSARSVIWHLSAIAKIPSWVLYYDNRNILYLLEKQHNYKAIKTSIRYSLKKSLYYAVLGKTDLANLHLDAINDYNARVYGKKDIKLNKGYGTLDTIEEILSQPEIKKVIFPWTINLQACNLQGVLVKLLKQRPELQIDYLIPPSYIPAFIQQLPGSKTHKLPKFFLFRYIFYLKQKNHYDILMQSDYQPIIPLNLVGKKILYINNDGLSLRSRPTLNYLLNHIKAIINLWLKLVTQ